MFTRLQGKNTSEGRLALPRFESVVTPHAHFPSPALPGSGGMGMISARCIEGTPYDLTTKLNGKSFFPKAGSSLLFFNLKHPPQTTLRCERTN